MPLRTEIIKCKGPSINFDLKKYNAPTSSIWVFFKFYSESPNKRIFAHILCTIKILSIYAYTKPCTFSPNFPLSNGGVSDLKANFLRPCGDVTYHTELLPIREWEILG